MQAEGPPRRALAAFTDENDHNPVVQEDCAHCHGRGKCCHVDCEDGRPVASLDTCCACGGRGTTGRVIPFFTNVNPPMGATPNPNGWIKCPHCGVRFKPTDRHAWTGLRHVNCGQKIRIE